MKQLMALMLLIVGAIGLLGTASAHMAGQELVSALQKGGYVIYMRHPKTNPDQGDTDPFNLDNVKAQRQLTDEGRKQAQDIGAALRALKIPVDKVISSKIYRASEAATLLNVGEVTTTMDVSEGGMVFSPNENKRRTEALKKLLGTLPPAGKNTIIVAHKPNIIDAAGKDLVDIGEAECAIFQPVSEGKFELVGRITATQWVEMAK